MPARARCNIHSRAPSSLGLRTRLAQTSRNWRLSVLDTMLDASAVKGSNVDAAFCWICKIGRRSTGCNCTVDAVRISEKEIVDCRKVLAWVAWQFCVRFFGEVSSETRLTVENGRRVTNSRVAIRISFCVISSLKVIVTTNSKIIAWNSTMSRHSFIVFLDVFLASCTVLDTIHNRVSC